MERRLRLVNLPLGRLTAAALVADTGCTSRVMSCSAGLAAIGHRGTSARTASVVPVSSSKNPMSQRCATCGKLSIHALTQRSLSRGGCGKRGVLDAYIVRALQRGIFCTALCARWVGGSDAVASHRTAENFPRYRRSIGQLQLFLDVVSAFLDATAAIFAEISRPDINILK